MSLSPEDKKVIEGYTRFVEKKLDKGVHPEKIASELVKSGWTEDSAIEFVEQIEARMDEWEDSPEGRSQLLHRAMRRTIIGFILLAIGISSLILSALEIKKGNGMMFIAIGPLLVGGYLFLVGLFDWLDYRQ